MKENKRFLEQHRFDIWQGTNGKWYTYLPDEKKGRIQRQRNSKKESSGILASVMNQILETYIKISLYG